MEYPKKINEKSWMSANEQLFLYNFIKKNAKGDVLELGTFRGGTTKLIRDALPKKYTVYSIDNFSDQDLKKQYNDYEYFQVNDYLSNFKNVQLIYESIQNVRWNKKVWASLFDANHDFYWMTLLFEKFQNYSEYIIVHDYHPDHAGVVLFIDWIAMLQTWDIVYIVDTLVILERRGK